MIGWFEIIVLSIVEGVTEFLPVSSTGHMLLAKSLLKMEDSEQLNAFLIIVQAGAILAVLTVFMQVFTRWIKAWLALFQNQKSNPETIAYRHQSLAVAVSVIPFGLTGFLLKDSIKALFSSSHVDIVAYALITGGVLILLLEYTLGKRKIVEKNFESMRYRDALIIGVGQCLALWPGFSRSAATILTGRILGYSRKSAAEISFIVGLPALLGTAGYESLKEYSILDSSWYAYLGVGILVAWVVAYICVKGFIAFLNRYPMSIFAYYRIVVGLLILFFFHRAN